MKTYSKLSAKQEKLIALLLTERKADLACAKAGVGVTTYWRWMKSEPFIGEYRRVRRSILENAVARLRSITSSAIDSLERNLYCENPSVEVRCASIILDQALKGVDILELENRVEILEHLLKEKEEIYG